MTITSWKANSVSRYITSTKRERERERERERRGYEGKGALK